MTEILLTTCQSPTMNKMTIQNLEGIMTMMSDDDDDVQMKMKMKMKMKEASCLKSFKASVITTETSQMGLPDYIVNNMTPNINKHPFQPLPFIDYLEIIRQSFYYLYGVDYHISDEELVERKLTEKEKMIIGYLFYYSVEDWVYSQRRPLVIRNLHRMKYEWPSSTFFSLEFLESNYSSMDIRPRDIETKEDLSDWNLGTFIQYLRLPRSERSPSKVYGKDISCPKEWSHFMTQLLPPYLTIKGSDDLSRHLPKEAQPECLMIYIGDYGSITPGHMDICSSIGHNILVHAEDGESYAFWFVISPEHKNNAIDLWTSRSGVPNALHLDGVLLSVKDFEEANFPIYFLEQRVGDFVILPSEAPHQVLNMGRPTIKISWNRIMPHTLAAFLGDIGNVYKRLCKSEVYRMKSIVYFSLANSWEGKARFENVDWQTLHEFERDWYIKETESLIYLLEFYKAMLNEDFILGLDDVSNSENLPQMVDKELEVPFTRVCDYCQCDIWNRSYHCSYCHSSDIVEGSSPGSHMHSMMGVVFNKNAPSTLPSPEGLDLCLECYARGRSCRHFVMTLMEQARRDELLKLESNLCQLLDYIIMTKIPIYCQPSSLKNFQNENVLDKVESHTMSNGSIAYRLCEYRQRFKEGHYNRTTQSIELPVCSICKDNPTNSSYKNLRFISCSHCTRKNYCDQCLFDIYGKDIYDGLKVGLLCPDCGKKYNKKKKGNFKAKRTLSKKHGPKIILSEKNEARLAVDKMRLLWPWIGRSGGNQETIVLMKSPTLETTSHFHSENIYSNGIDHHNPENVDESAILNPEYCQENITNQETACTNDVSQILFENLEEASLEDYFSDEVSFCLPQPLDIISSNLNDHIEKAETKTTCIELPYFDNVINHWCNIFIDFMEDDQIKNEIRHGLDVKTLFCKLLKEQPRAFISNANKTGPGVKGNKGIKKEKNAAKKEKGQLTVKLGKLKSRVQLKRKETVGLNKEPKSKLQMVQKKNLHPELLEPGKEASPRISLRRQSQMEPSLVLESNTTTLKRIDFATMHKIEISIEKLHHNLQQQYEVWDFEQLLKYDFDLDFLRLFKQKTLEECPCHAEKDKETTRTYGSYVCKKPKDISRIKVPKKIAAMAYKKDEDIKSRESEVINTIKLTERKGKRKSTPECDVHMTFKRSIDKLKSADLEVDENIDPSSEQRREPVEELFRVAKPLYDIKIPKASSSQLKNATTINEPVNWQTDSILSIESTVKAIPELPGITEPVIQNASASRPVAYKDSVFIRDWADKASTPVASIALHHAENRCYLTGRRSTHNFEQKKCSQATNSITLYPEKASVSNEPICIPYHHGRSNEDDNQNIENRSNIPKEEHRNQYNNSNNTFQLEKGMSFKHKQFKTNTFSRSEGGNRGDWSDRRFNCDNKKVSKVEQGIRIEGQETIANADVAWKIDEQNMIASWRPNPSLLATDSHTNSKESLEQLTSLSEENMKRTKEECSNPVEDIHLGNRRTASMSSEEGEVRSFSPKSSPFFFHHPHDRKSQNHHYYPDRKNYSTQSNYFNYRQ